MRDRHQRGLEDFGVFETKDFRPIIAFTSSEDPVRDRVLNSLDCHCLILEVAWMASMVGRHFLLVRPC